MLKVSIGICTKNNFFGLKRTLFSICHQNSFPDFSKKIEFIILDSSEKSEQKKIRLLLKKLKLKYGADFKYYFSPKKGISFARNIAIAKAKYEYLYFLDDDIETASGWLNNLFSEIENSSKPKIIYGKINPVDKVTGKKERWIEKIESENPWILTSIKRPNPYILPFTANVGIHKSTFKKVGLFNESFASFEGPISQPFGEDPEFFLRAKRLGIPYTFSKKLMVKHWVSHKRSSKKYLFMRYFDDGKNILLFRIYEKFYGQKKIPKIELTKLFILFFIKNLKRNTTKISSFLIQLGIIKMYISVLNHTEYYNRFLKVGKN